MYENESPLFSKIPLPQRIYDVKEKQYNYY